MEYFGSNLTDMSRRLLLYPPSPKPILLTEFPSTLPVYAARGASKVFLESSFTLIGPSMI